ncbi:MAG: ERCC4 domain-containing protein [Acidiferrobacteraceae bacterium]
MPSTEQPVHLKVDRREKGRIIEQLGALPLVTLEMADLECGDYVGAGGLAIERKSATDFILSIVDRSLYERAARLRSRYGHPVYIVEGDLFTRRFHQKAFDVHAALAYLTVHYAIPVLTAPDTEHSAMIIYLMAAEAEHRLGRPIDVRVEHPVVTTEAQLYFLQGLPGIDGERAERLLQELHSVKAVLEASDNELRDIARVDDETVSEIREVLNKAWPV